MEGKGRLRGGFDVGVFGKRILRRLEEGGTPDKWVHGVSDTIGEGKRGSTRAGPAAWFGPRRGTTHARRSNGPRGKKWAAGPKARRRKFFFFFFLFNYFKAFSNDFET
jgi:hypothetical protein